MKLYLLNPYWINQQLEKERLEKEGEESGSTSVEECSDRQDPE